MNRYVMSFSHAEGAWIVCYADSLADAERKYESGMYQLEEDDIL